jgi:hypothetical protein
VPSVWDYLPPPSYRRAAEDPIHRLPGGDELAAELAEAIDARLAQGERHVHAKRGGCTVCANEVADTVVRYLEANTRVIKSEALAPDEFARARAAVKAMPYLASGAYLRLSGSLGIHPDHPTVDDLLVDLETIRDALQVVVEHDNRRDEELRTYRKWRDAVQGLATQVVAQLAQLDDGMGGDE